MPIAQNAGGGKRILRLHGNHFAAGEAEYVILADSMAIGAGTRRIVDGLCWPVI